MQRAAASLLLLSAALCAPGACFAQADAPGATAMTDAMPATSSADPRSDETRSAFGRVMAVMISALQRQASAPATEASADPVRTTAAGTPLDIEVGAAFSDAMRADAVRGAGADGASRPGRQPSAEAAEARLRTARPSELALRQAALAGPD